MTDTDDLLRRLRDSANEIALAGHNGWGNACAAAADEIERLRAEVATIKDSLTVAESELAALRGRIAAAPVVCIDNGACVTDGARLTIAGGDTYFAHAELCGKRVRLVVDEG